MLVESSLESLYPVREAKSISLMVMEHLNYKKRDIYLRRDEILGKDQLKALLHYIGELKARKPVQYVLGHTLFYDLRIMVGPGVFIPRPETEELVDWIIHEHHGQTPAILDAGTGSGCIALALAVHLPGSRVTGLDNSTSALAMAEKNGTILNTPVQWLKADLTDRTGHNTLGFFDLVVSNPPYVPLSEKAAMSCHITDNEPPEAIFVPDSQPLLYYKHIIDLCNRHLAPQGRVYFEIHENYHEQVHSILLSEGYIRVELRKDINGKYRMIRGQKHGKHERE